jgi:hypothetical protein
MGGKTRQNMAARLNFLMSNSPLFDTNEKVAVRSGVSYGTVRRIRKAEPIDVQIGHVEDVAACFGLSLVAFIADFDQATELTPEECATINDLRSLDAEDAKRFCEQIARMAMLQRTKINQGS